MHLSKRRSKTLGFLVDRVVTNWNKDGRKITVFIPRTANSSMLFLEDKTVFREKCLFLFFFHLFIPSVRFRAFPFRCWRVQFLLSVEFDHELIRFRGNCLPSNGARWLVLFSLFPLLKIWCKCKANTPEASLNHISQGIKWILLNISDSPWTG